MSSKSKLDKELERYAIKLLKDASSRNNASRVTATSSTAEGSAVNTQPLPTLAERAKILEAVTRLRMVQAKIEDADDDSPGSGGSLDDLRSRLNGGKAGGGSAGSATATGARPNGSA